MDASIIANKLDSVIAQLKAIGGGFSFSKDAKGKVHAKVTKEEAEKLKISARITASEYKKVLGLGFNPRDVTETAKIFDKVIGFKVFFTSIQEQLSDSISKMDSFGKVKTKDASGVSVNKLLKGLEWYEFKDALMNYVDQQKYHQKIAEHSLSKMVSYMGEANKPKSKEKGKGLEQLGNLAGLAIIGIGLFLIINALANSGKLDLTKTLKVLGILALLIGIFVLVGKLGGSIKSAAIGFAILSATVAFLIIPLIQKLQKMEWSVLLDGLKKFSLIVGACIGLMILMKFIKKSDVIVATGGLIVLGLVVGFLLIPLFQRLNEISWDIILDGLGKFSLIVGACIGLMILMGFIKKGDVIVAMAAMVVMVYLVGYLADNLEKYADKPWDAISEGLKIAGIAFGTFFAMFTAMALMAKGAKLAMVIAGAIMFELVYLVGYLADNLEKYANKDWNAITEGLKVAGIAFGALVAAVGILALAMFLGGPIAIVAGAVGAGIMLALAKVMDMAANSLLKFQEIDGEKLIQVAKGMVAIGGGLVAMLVGTGAGVVGGIASGLASLFGADPVSQLKKFEKLDADKLLNLGIGIKFLAEGLSILSKGIELKDITDQLVNMTSPLLQFSTALIGFAAAYKMLDKVKMEAEMNQMYKMNVQNDSGIHKAILETNQQELAVQQAQLDQLKYNGDLLKQIASKGGVGGSGMGIPPTPSGTSITTPSFTTKDNYMNNMKLMNMTIQ